MKPFYSSPKGEQRYPKGKKGDFTQNNAKTPKNSTSVGPTPSTPFSRSGRFRTTPEEILSANILKTLFRLSIPTMIAFTFQTTFNFVDRFFISKTGDLQLGAIGMSFAVQSILIAIGSGIGAGSSSIVARLIGAGKRRDASIAAEHSLLIVVVFSIVFTAFGPLLTKPLFRLLGASPLMLPYVLDYINIILLGSFFQFFSMIGNGIIRGEGNTVTPMRVMLAGTFTNIILDPILIFGLGPIPALGIKGAAIATVIGRGVSSLILAFSIFGEKNIIKINFKIFHFDFSFVRGVFSVGGPSIVSQLASSLGLSLLFVILRQYGDSVKAAFTMGFTYQQIAFLPIIGMSMGVLTMVGQNFGAGNYARVRETLFKALLSSTLLIGLFTVIYSIGNDRLVRIFSDAPEVVRAGKKLLMILSFGFPFIAIRMVVVNLFQGLGRGFRALIINLLQMIGLTIPLAALFSYFMGVDGVWYGFFAGNVITAIVAGSWAIVTVKHLDRLKRKGRIDNLNEKLDEFSGGEL